MKSTPSNSYALSRLKAEVRPFRLHFVSRCNSTNTLAADLRRRGDLYAPAVVVTSHQLAGRGRGSNKWFSNPGVLTATFVLPIEEGLQPHQLPLVAGLAIRSAAASLTEYAPIQLKWPNDLVFEGRKLAGLLCERIEKADLIGVGLNVNVAREQFPKSLRDSATSLSIIAGKPFDLTFVLSILAKHLHATLKSRSVHSFSVFREEYDQHHALVGRKVKVLGTTPPISGTCTGIDHLGRLLVKDRGATRPVISGEVLW